MRKSQKILLGFFFAGALLCGAGTGVAISEYASMTYLGERQLGAELTETENLDYTFDPVQGDLTVELAGFAHHLEKKAELEEDPAVPENTVRFEVTYIPECMDLFVEEEAMPEDVQEKSPETRKSQGAIRLDWRYYDTGKLLIMEKDKIIADLKNHSFASYRTNLVEAVAVKVNPATAEYVRLED